MGHRYLPKTLELDGINYKLAWEGNGNMDGWICQFNIGRSLSTEPDEEGISELLWFQNRNSQYASCPFTVYANGDVVCQIKV